MATPVTPAWQLWRDRRGRISALRVATLLLLLLPLAKAVFEANDIAHGARPLNELIHRAGFWALVFLGVTLAVTPFRRIFRYANLIDVRRMLGVGTFCYIAAHLALFFADQSYSFGKFIHEITHRVYLIVGAVAWIGLAALAATSTDGMVRRLGGMRWRRLHQAIYAIALLALIHYFQQTKADVTVPTFAAGLFLWLIAYRVLAWWQGSGELSTLSLFVLAIAVSVATFLGEAIGIAIAFHVSPMRVLGTIFDFDAGIRPGWQVLAAGLAVDRGRCRHVALETPYRARPRGGGRIGRSDLAAVVSPMQQRLPLPRPAEQIAGLAMFLHLAHVTADRFPPPDLPLVFLRHAPAHVIAAVPLEPAARIVRMDPAFALPFRKRLARSHTEEIARGVGPARREFGARKPAFRELAAAVGHVFAAEDAKPQHLRGRELRFEFQDRNCAPSLR